MPTTGVSLKGPGPVACDVYKVRQNRLRVDTGS